MEASDNEAPTTEVARRGVCALMLQGQLRASEIEVAGVELMVVSYPAEPSDLLARSRLTKSEAHVAVLAIDGMSNAEIAAARGTSERTVANQMASVLRKLRVVSRRELAAEFVRGTLRCDGAGGSASKSPVR